MSKPPRSSFAVRQAQRLSAARRRNPEEAPEAALSYGYPIAIGCSVIGGSHVRKGLPNQDSYLVRRDPKNGALFVAVADGVGSEPRAEEGSSFAVRAAADAMSHFYRHLPPANRNQHKFVECLAKAELVKSITSRWRTMVSSLTGLSVSDDMDHFASTLVAATFTAEFILILRLGDSDCIFVQQGGKTIVPIEADQSCKGNNTSSISWLKKEGYLGAEDVMDLVVTAYPKNPNLGSMIMLSSDGLSKSCGSDVGFQKLAHQYLEQLIHDGPAAFAQAMPALLYNAANAEWTKDDTTAVCTYLPPLMLP